MAVIDFCKKKSKPFELLHFSSVLKTGTKIAQAVGRSYNLSGMYAVEEKIWNTIQEL